MLKLRAFPLTLALAASLGAQQQIALVAPEGGSTPSGHAVRLLEETLARQGVTARRLAAARDVKPGELLLTLRISAAPDGSPESFAIRKRSTGGQAAVTVTGGGETGLAYGIFELLGQVEAAGAPFDLYRAADVERRPQVKVRSLAMSLYNRDLERDWFFSPEFWNRYFALLAQSRLNQFTLIFGHQTSYFAPLFPFMIDVAGYERVRTPDYTAEDRRRNLEALRMISALADEWGIRFVLGIWQQHANNYGRNLVEGLAYEDLFDYCPKALAILLRQCPHIRGVQLRMNSESGIAEDDQNRFFTGMAKAIRSVGRPIWTDFRAKGLRPETVASIQSVGFPVTISTKFWREHMGLPYHGTRIDPLDKQRSYRRYGYWDLLYQNRGYDVLYRMWTFGSQKILLWGSLDYARRFAQSTHLGDAAGFEIFAPVSQKGFGNWQGGAWRVIADPKLEHYRWEFERYWAYYLSFGLGGYSASGPQPVLDGEFRRRFGKAADAVRQAYDAASWIVPFLTAIRNQSSSNFHYWPEMDTGGLTARYVQLGTGDDNRFYRIDEYVADMLAGRASARMTPPEMAARLEGWAGAVRTAVERAAALVPAGSKEFALSRIDFSVLADLAEYHARRLRSAEAYEFFARTGERACLLRAIAQYREALERWTAIAQRTGGVFYDHMVFNRPPEQIGHWKDELPFLRAELSRLEEIDRVFLAACEKPEQALAWKIPQPWAKMAMKWKEERGVLTRWADTTLAPEQPAGEFDNYAVEDPKSAVKSLLTEFRYAKILHAPVRRAVAGRPVTVHASLLGPRAVAKLTLFYRSAGAGFRFTSVQMTAQEKNVYSSTIPAGKAGETLYYYIRASDQTEFFHGSAKEPHTIAVAASPAPRPAIQHDDIAEAAVGKEVRVEAKIRSAARPAAVRLYYRHLDQSEDWIAADMAERAAGVYRAAIPGEFVVPGWDLMYAIEAVDAAGAGSFYPDLEVRQPFVVVRVHP